VWPFLWGGVNLIVFYFLSMSEIWPDKRGCLWWEWPYWSGEYCITQITMTFILMSLNTVKPAHVITSIKQSPVLRGHLFLVLP
jgi:hypothetical protein